MGNYLSLKRSKKELNCKISFFLNKNSFSNLWVVVFAVIN